MQTARFRQLRKKSLSKIFTKKKIEDTWRQVVRAQLRDQEIKDLYDHYDLNYNIAEKAVGIRTNILSGSYKSSRSLVYRLEKKLGICRHMIIPQPVDALVLQVLAGEIATSIIKKAPSKKAFFSRNLPKPPSLSDPGVISSYDNFSKLWIKLQEVIYSFTTHKKLIVMTDLSNYYDSINVDELKKVLLSCIKKDEVLIDLLFSIVKDISWQPDYLPYTGRGLPTSNLEAIRLLAHMFLYEIDAVLKSKSKDFFTRWMDDIVVGVDNHKQGTEIVSSVSDMIKSRGLALNLTKTSILDSKTASYHFQFKENKFLSNVKIPKKEAAIKKLALKLLARFKKHKEDTKPKSWEKITKRYITLFGKMKSDLFLKEFVDLYVNNPGVRTNLLIYLNNLEYNSKTSSKLKNVLLKIDIFDDISLYQICYLLTQWQIPAKKYNELFLFEIEKHITNITFKNKAPSNFYSLMWFRAKYSKPDTLLNFLIKYENFWQADHFLKRQATALFSRLYLVDPQKVNTMLSAIASSGDNSSTFLANQILRFSNITTLEPKIHLYLFPTHKQKIYPLSKYLVLCSILNSKVIREDINIQRKVIEYVQDPYYVKYLKELYKIPY